MNDARSRNWRSLLFVPADNRRLIDGAPQRRADALILDLEDAVAVDRKAAARASLPAVISTWAQQHVTTLVRVNADSAALDDDLDAAVRSGTAAIVLPKVEDVGVLHQIDALISTREAQRGLAAGSVQVVALIESPAALFCLAQIAAGPRLCGLAFGSEDFALALGVPPTLASLTLPCQLIALAAAAYGIRAFGLPASLGNYGDLGLLRAAAHSARAFGMGGALCIHPAQVALANDAFSPSEQELQWARAVLAAWHEAGASGVVSLDGKMIDKPVVERAQAMLAANL
ncbi:citrate lyase subunit beta/citryl-CoA lyase [Paraburkholderia sp. BL27I4N3]|uniref:HpcH/HpaI aldolase/citrate lyase family protein n=1 Tax=Paraburkholderia sp. BL27I4N3 TaxID=1938805 RepID=UPI000E248898|nr:CoA ester lyase [Paraburkholderia sp. BL27I4N3]REE07402.1 citrate lyase subunit beta/citryl-CoA lyase [Paraburkholderia sp. BL27I4N3]